MKNFEHSTIEYGPQLEQTMLTSGLDYYKPNMSFVAFEQEPNAEVTFTFHNRGEQRLLDYVDIDSLQERLNQIQQKGFNDEEINYLRNRILNNGDPLYSEEYVKFIATNRLPDVNVHYDQEIDDIAIETTGPWALTTFWETVVMSELNEAYFEGYMRKNNLDPFDVYDEADRRLTEKIEKLKANPNVKFADFGTRRHFSTRWHKHVIERVLTECPENFVGTSNVGLAQTLDIKPIGTFAHEMPMVFAGLADARGEDIRASHNKLLQVWFDTFGKDLSIALTDTFGTDFFFSDFTPEQAKIWNGTRQDSGDPYIYGHKAFDYYNEVGVNPKEKQVVFSDGLDIDPMIELQNHFDEMFNVLFGLGTKLTNDTILKALNIVMKATDIKIIGTNLEAKLVKVSDDEGKHTGPEELVNEYIDKIFKVVTKENLNEYV